MSSSHAPDAPSLEVLRCTGCGADLPLGDGDEVRCAHCGAVVPVPAPYRELRAAARSSEEDRKRAEALLRTLDRPPWLVTRVLAATFDQPMFAFLILFGIPFGLASILIGLRGPAVYAQHAGLGSADDVPFTIPILLCLGTLFLFAFVPRALGVYANRRTSARALLLASLAAKPPGPHGTCRCRMCGAPLEVAEGATVVRCLYCHADNALVLRTRLLAKAKAAVASVRKTIVEAARLDAVERSGTRRRLLRELGRYAATFGVFGVLLTVYAVDTDRPAVRAGDATPGMGIAALVVTTLLLIVLLARSLGRSGEREKLEAQARREGTGVPGWVRIAGPLAFWLLLCVISRFHP